MIYDALNEIKERLEYDTQARKVVLGVSDFKPLDYPLIAIDYATTSDSVGEARPFTTLAYSVPIKIYSQRRREDDAIRILDDVLLALQKIVGSAKSLTTTIEQDYDGDDFIITINFIKFIAITRRD